MHTQVPLIIAAESCKSHAYVYDPIIPAIIDGKHPLRCLLGMDSEFTEGDVSTVLDDMPVTGRQGVTVQVCGLPGTPATIFTHPHHVEYAKTTKRSHLLRHPTMENDFAGFDYLQFHGYDLTPHHDDDYTPRLEKSATILFDIIAFFALAEMGQVVTGRCLRDVVELCKSPPECITQHRRLVTRDGPAEGEMRLDFVEMPWSVTLNGYDYRVRLRIIDTCAVQGIGSYKDLLITAGLPVEDKDLMKDLGLITTMHEAYFTHPVEYDTYALNDLHNYPALIRYAELTKDVWQALGMKEYYTPPKLTIGATVADMFRAKIRQLFGITPEQVQDKDANAILTDVLHFGTAQYFRERTDSTMVFLAKVLGGRCKAERALLAMLEAVLCDLDLSGCYAQGLRAQLYPFGRPCVIDYPAHSKYNDYPSVREFLKVMRYGTTRCELIPGLWQAHICLQDGHTLKYPQDLFPSWFGFNDHKDRNQKPLDEFIVDAQTPNLELDPQSGFAKILANRIEHSVLTSDSLEWILYACSARQRDELLDYLEVRSAVFYPASERVDSIDTLRERLTNHPGKNTCQIRIQKGLRSIIRCEQECYAWYGVNLGEFFVDTLLAFRKLYPKKDDKGLPIPMNTLFKLICNTLFGVMVSPFFDVGNTTVGANITSRARAACWYMAKGLNGIQSITDGVQFDLNRVVYPRTRLDRNVHLTANDFWTLRRENTTRINYRMRLAPLGGYTRIAQEYDAHNNPILTCYHNDQVVARYETKSAIETFINTECMRHLQQLWPKEITVLHGPSTSLKIHNEGSQDSLPQVYFEPRVGLFEFEMKDLYDAGTFHSSANHSLHNVKATETKARSYDKRKDYYAIHLVDGTPVFTPTFHGTNPAKIFLEVHLQHPSAVPRSEVFIRRKLIKPKEWVARYTSFFQHNGLIPGDSYWVCGLLSEFSLSTFTMNSVEQFKALNREYERCKEQYRQYVEPFFLNPDGTLNYQEMIETCQALIEEGHHSLLRALDPHENVTRTLTREHPALETFRAVQAHLTKIQGGVVIEDMDTVATTVDDE